MSLKKDGYPDPNQNEGNSALPKLCKPVKASVLVFQQVHTASHSPSLRRKETDLFCCYEVKLRFVCRALPWKEAQQNGLALALMKFHSHNGSIPFMHLACYLYFTVIY